MTQGRRRPSFVAFAFDYASSSDWADLPHLRKGVSGLVDALSYSMTQQLSHLAATSPPTRVMEALERLLFEILSPDDSVLIYVGGHGARLGDDHFIVGPEAQKKNLTVRSGLSSADLAQVIVQGRPRQVTLILDACYSGAAAARLAADADAVMSRQRRDEISLSMISSARSLDEAVDGALIDTLLSVLSDPNPVLWSRKDKFIPPRHVARALNTHMERIVEFREHGYVEPLFPNLTYQIPTAAELARRTRDHFVVATSGVELGGSGWHFVGRTQALSSIVSWLATEPSGIFVVTGPPGSGKSAILGRVALLADPQGRDEVTTRDASFDQSAPTAPALGAISVAIHAREKTLETLVTEIADGLGITSSVTSRDEILALLSERSEPTCILIDALDEAFGSDAVPIAEFLRDLADLSRVRVLVGTRPDRARATAGSSRSRFGPILRALEPARVWDLEHHHENGAADVIAYVKARLSGPNSAYIGRDEIVHAIAQEVAQRVNGVFLYARLIVQALLREPPLVLEAGWEARLPGSEGGDLLASVVAEDLQRTPPRARDRIRHMLMALAWAEGEGLPRYRVWPAAAMAITGLEYSDSDATDTIQFASWYLVESMESEQAVYRLNHEELVRYFRELTKREL